MSLWSLIAILSMDYNYYGVLKLINNLGSSIVCPKVTLNTRDTSCDWFESIGFVFRVMLTVCD